MQRISFGTSGWRGILCEDFTFENIRVVTQAIADHVRASDDRDKGLIVGYDTRFMGEKFAKEAARILTGAGIKTYICKRDTPTPAIAFEILRRKTAGAINFTASHNPSEYNGIKFSPAWGGPALPETTRDIERRANEMAGQISCRDKFLENSIQSALLEEIDPREAYLKELEEKIDFASMAGCGVVAVNPLYGAGCGYLDELLERHNVKTRLLHVNRDPYFGGFPPEPSEKYMQDFINLVKNDADVKLGLATDGDADRFGIVDEDGSFIEPNYILALLLDYLIRVRGMKGGVARSVATSHLVDAVAAKHGIEVFETPVGFKYIGELISRDSIVIGGEESAGLTIRGHVPEKDGILACFLVAEMVARERMSVRKLLDRLYSEVGRFLTRRENITLSPMRDAGFSEKVQAIPSTFAGSRVKDVITIDGTKCILEDGRWLLFRKSGTEPVVRLYGEASSEIGLQDIMAAGREFILK